ncbi:tRNA (adenine(58)-N(1))-methyltransferase catalytic subunit trmt61a [Boothiomyces macroporosus]|uniref:Kinetochore protein SPC25 n=1 Tax=Boothiomyces macroporosus TaxID=261099 RepID=A0AAD5Y398_9FUNG|nr:tRNA (adenine(58)-N(1))-methyltransferase catalytic subunit trmt61a [Boothiomyces macroporosus]
MTDLKQNNLNFQQSLEEWINQKRQTLDGYKRNYQDKVNALKDQHQSLVLFQKSLEKKQQQLLLEIQQYDTKKQDLLLDLQEINVKEEQQYSQLQDINRAVNNLQLEINQKLKEQEKTMILQKERKAIAQPTLLFYQKILSLYIQPLGVVGCNPPIQEMDDLTRELNQSKDFYGFIKKNPSDMKAFQVKKDQVFANKFGAFEHNKIIGKQYGEKMASKSNTGFIYLLYPTPELWTLALPHRTQILYQPDISLVTNMLNLQPGSVMIEAGTGSGSFSHSISRTTYPNGHLYTFEYHQERAQKALLEFKEHGLNNITVEHRDVCKNGFGIENKVNADLPSPWEAIENAKRAFLTDRIGYICCFSPCIEQVTRTCTKLKEEGFVDLSNIGREHNVRKIQILKLPTDNKSVNRLKRPNEDEIDGVLATRIKPQVRGHTSFLTFAMLLPKE